jgi:hypothetical protein
VSNNTGNIEDVQLNNPFFLGQSHYFENEPNNLSWLKSTGEFHSKEVYPSIYSHILENVKAEIKDFKTINDNYDDYCFVVDEQNQTFRLPLLNGSENLPGSRNVDLKNQMVKDTTIAFTAPGNGQYTFGVYSTGVGQAINVHNVSSDRGISIQSGRSSGLVKANLEAKRGDLINVSYTLGGNINNGVFKYHIGNGSLYYYVGETVQNANIIDAGNIQAQLTNKLDTNLTNLPQDRKSYLSSISMPSNKYIDLTLGASGTQYTAPANGYIHLCKMATAAHQYIGINPLELYNGIGSSDSLYYDQSTTAQTLAGFIPVRKGEQFFIYYTAQGQVCAFRFIYAEGEQ